MQLSHDAESGLQIETVTSPALFSFKPRGDCQPVRSSVSSRRQSRRMVPIGMTADDGLQGDAAEIDERRRWEDGGCTGHWKMLPTQGARDKLLDSYSMKSDAIPATYFVSSQP